MAKKKTVSRRKKPIGQRPAGPITEDELRGLNQSAWRARTVTIGVSVGIFERLAKSPATVQQVSRDLHCQKRAVELLLNALVGMGLLRRRGSVYANTSLAGRLLVPKGAESVAAMFLHHDQMWDSWGLLADAVRVGRPPRPPTAQAADERAAQIYINAMHTMGVRFATHLAKAFPTTGPVRMLDVGGGSGIWSVHFARANKQLSALVFDLPDTVKFARKLLKDMPERKRVKFFAGDFNADKLPDGQNIVLLSQVIHSLDEEQIAKLFKKIHQAMADGGTLLVRDMLTNADRTSPPGASLFALNMLLHTDGGRTYSVEEVKDWLKEAGFKKVSHHKVVPGSNTSVLKATK